MGNYLQNPTLQTNTLLYTDNKFINHTINNITYTTLNGILECEYIIFDKEGKIMSKSVYKNGKLCGIKTDYNVFMYLNGEMVKVKKYEQLYENGVEISTNTIL